MTFKNWILSEHAALGLEDINGAWKLPHILVLILCVVIIVALALLLRKKSERTRRIAIFCISGCILFFEIARRVINFYKLGQFSTTPTIDDVLYRLLPRPWCAISCWLLIACPYVNKKWFYNFTSTNAFVCALIYFAYPVAGFSNEVWLFENVYSICTHMMLLIGSISLITLRMTDFKYTEDGTLKRSALRELIALGCVFVYATVLILTNIEDNPLYFMPTGDYVLAGEQVQISNDVMEILGMGKGLFIIVYIAFLALYFNLFYLIQNYKGVGKFLSCCAKKVKELFQKGTSAKAEVVCADSEVEATSSKDEE